MKQKVFFSLFFVAVFIIGCTSTGPSSSKPSELVISNSSRWSIYIHIEGKDRINLDSGKIISFKIANGRHIINADLSWRSNAPKPGSISFDCNNERILINVNEIEKELKFEIVSRTALYQQQNNTTTPLLEKAISNSFNTLNSLIPNDSKVAIVDISPSDSNTVFIQEELMVLFVNSRKFNVVDRQTLDSIRQEQRFQMTGEVSDETAISVGHFLGADVVIVGTVSGTGTQKRLRLRALNVKTAQVIAMASESI
jgi:hypothetical protein